MDLPPPLAGRITTMLDASDLQHPPPTTVIATFERTIQLRIDPFLCMRLGVSKQPLTINFQPLLLLLDSLPCRDGIRSPAHRTLQFEFGQQKHLPKDNFRTINAS